MAEEINYKAGDIFTIEIADNEFAFGRVVFDAKGQGIDKGLINSGSTLALTEKDTIFIEIFKQTSNEQTFDKSNLDILIPGIFTLNLDLVDFLWKIVDYIEIDPIQVDFPEFLSVDGPFNGKFIKGEIEQQVEISMPEVEEIMIYPSIKSVITIPEYILHALGRENEIRENRRPLRDMKVNDLRFSDYREKVYALLPPEFKKPYYELAKEKGFDLARFYE